MAEEIVFTSTGTVQSEHTVKRQLRKRILSTPQGPSAEFDDATAQSCIVQFDGGIRLEVNSADLKLRDRCRITITKIDDESNPTGS